jgi:aerobic C4-dicarboxylate transport protein
VLQTLLVALLVGFALQALGAAGEPILRGIGTSSGWCSGSWR